MPPDPADTAISDTGSAPGFHVRVTFDHGVRLRVGRSDRVAFARDEVDVEVPVLAPVDAPIVARYVTPSRIVELRRVGTGLWISIRSPPTGSRRPPASPFARFLVAGAVPRGRIREAEVVSCEREPSLREVHAFAQRCIAVRDVVHVPTDGMVVVGAKKVSYVSDLESVLSSSSIDMRRVWCVSDPDRPQVPGLEIADPDLARCSFDRERSIRRQSCNRTLVGLHADLMRVDTRLARKWIVLWGRFRKGEDGSDMVEDCADLLASFSKAGHGRRATRLGT